MFPKEGQSFYFSQQPGISMKWEVAVIVVLTCVLIGMVWARWHGDRYRYLRWLNSRPKRTFFIVYLGVSLTFGFVYHALFQHDPFQFKINAPIADARMFEAIEQHETAITNVSEAEQILGLTVAGLRLRIGRKLLSDFAEGLPGDMKRMYVDCLLLGVVGPPQFESRQALEFGMRSIGVADEQIDTRIKEYETIERNDPRFLSDLRALNPIEQMSTSDLDSLRDLVFIWLGKYLHEYPKPGEYQNETDSRNLEDFIAQKLAVDLAPGETVDLALAASVRQNHLIPEEESPLHVGTQSIGRFVDFCYFSLTTATTIGYGDILPNSTCSRIAVMCEVICAMVIFALLVNEFSRGVSSRKIS